MSDEKQLTWKDAEVGSVYVGRSGYLILKTANTSIISHGLFDDGSTLTEDFDDEEVTLIGKMQPEWWKDNYEGFIVPDEVLNPKEADPQPQPATDFKPGDWFWDSDHDSPLLKMGDGAIRWRGGKIYFISDKVLEIAGHFENCTPVDDDFVPPIHILTGAVQELVDYCAKISPKSNILHGLWQAVQAEIVEVEDD